MYTWQTTPTKPRSKTLVAGLEGLKTNSADSINVEEKVTVSGATRLANRLKGNSTLKVLCLNCCALTADHVVALAEALDKSALRTVYLGFNDINARGVESLIHAARLANSLETLSLYGSNIKDEGAVILGEFLPKLKLVSLDLGNNGITDVGGVALAQGLASSRLKDLLLAANELTDVSGEAIARSIKINARLVSLDLQGNHDITDATATQLCTSLRTHGSMKNVTLSPGTRISVESNQIIHSRLALLHCKKSRTMVVLCSAKYITRIGQHSPCRWLSPDLVRAVCDAITFANY